jgi:hypothetical protein
VVNVLLFDGLLKIALAEVEARAGDPDRSVAILDERWRRPTTPAIARSKRSCTGRAAKCCSRASPSTRRLQKTPS